MSGLSCFGTYQAMRSVSPFIDRLEWLSYVGLWSDRPAVQDWIGRMKARPAYQRAMPGQTQRLSPSSLA